MSKLDFREKVKSYSEPYQHEDWLRMKQLLDEDATNHNQSLLWFWKSSFLILALFATILSISWTNLPEAGIQSHELKSDQDSETMIQEGPIADSKIKTMESLNATSEESLLSNAKQEASVVEASTKIEIQVPSAVSNISSIPMASNLKEANSQKDIAFNSKTDKTVSSNKKVIPNATTSELTTIAAFENKTSSLSTSEFHKNINIYDETNQSLETIPHALEKHPMEIAGIKGSNLTSINSSTPLSLATSITDIPTLNKSKSYINLSASIKFPNIYIQDQDFGKFKSSQTWATSFGGEIGYIMTPLEKMGVEAGIEGGILQFKTGKKMLISDHFGNPLPIDAHITEKTSFIGPYIRAHYINELSTKNLVNLSIAYHYNFVRSKDYANAEEECVIGRLNDLRRSDCVVYDGEVIYALKDSYASSQLGQLEFGANYIHKISNKNHLSIGMNYRLGLNEVLSSKYSFLYEYHNENYSIGEFNSNASGLELKLGYWFG